MSATDQYFALLDRIRSSLAAHRYAEALQLSYESLPLLPKLVASCSREYGRFDIRSIPCLEVGARFSAAQGDVERLAQLRAWMASIPELAPWVPEIDERLEAASVQRRILDLLGGNPGCLQSAVPKVLGVPGRVTGRLVADMEHLGYVTRRPQGRGYALFLAGDPRADALSAEAKPARATRKVVPVDPTDTWIALDFETATSERHSACCLGVAVIQSGAVVSSGAWLIKPPGSRYERANVAIHGISRKRTRSAPTYAELYPSVEPFLRDRFVVAHYAPFDVSVLRAVHQYYGIPLPPARYACSCEMARRAFPRLDNHRLPTVCDHCGIPLQHHDAASDAIACAKVALSCRGAVGADSLHDAVKQLGIAVKRL